MTTTTTSGSPTDGNSTIFLIEHSGDGTTASGTARGDASNDILKANGFRWSRNLDSWFLPRTWHEATRAVRVRQVVAALERADLAVTVEYGDIAKSTTAEERATAHVDRAAELANRHAARADRRSAEADTLFDRSHEAVAGISFGQPILVGHHSQRRHENAIDKSWNLLGKGVEASREAEEAKDRARASAAEASGYDQPARVGRRIEKNRAELGRWERNRVVALRTSSESDWLTRADASIAELRDAIARDQAVLDASGVTAYSRETIAVGDLVKIRGRWNSVDKANPKTVAVTAFGLTLSYPYTEIQEHLKPTADQARQMWFGRDDRDLRDTLRSRKLAPETRTLIEEILAERSSEPR